MSLTITPVPDARLAGGPSWTEGVYQLQPGSADYPAGGYLINAGSTSASSSGVPLYEMFGADIIGGNAASGLYVVDFVLPSGSFGANPGPSQSMNMVVLLSGAASAPGTPLGLGALSATSTTVGVTSNVLTVAQVNTFKAGQFVYLQSFTAGGAINGTIVQLASATAAGWTANYPTPNITAATADVTGTAQLVQAGPGNLLTTGTVANITNSLATSSLITMTCANTFQPGQFVIIQGLTNGATSNGVIVQVATASGTQFTANWTGTAFSTAADTGTASLLVTAGGAPVTVGAAFAVTNSLATASSAGTAGVITLTALNSLVPGNITVVQGLTNGAAANGDILVVIPTGLTNAKYESNHKTAAFTSGADVGTVSLLVTGAPTGPPTVSPGTDLSGASWFANFYGY